MLFAEFDGCGVVIFFIVVGFLGEGVTHLSERMTALREIIRKWSIVLGILSGIAYFVAGVDRH